jgi:hypothetical protein
VQQPRATHVLLILYVALLECGPSSPSSLGSTEVIRALFVGNSHTEANDLPALISAMMRSGSRPSTYVETVTQGGATLRFHWEEGIAAERIRSGRFTHVVLQGQNTESCFNSQEYAHYVSLFARLAGAKGAKVLLFGMWPRGPDDPVYDQTGITTPRLLAHCMALGVRRAAALSSTSVVDVASPWMRVLRERPTLRLWQSDQIHPSPAGTYLAACRFVEALSGRNAIGISARPPSVSVADANWLARVSAER